MDSSFWLFMLDEDEALQTIPTSKTSVEENLIKHHKEFSNPTYITLTQNSWQWRMYEEQNPTCLIKKLFKI